jgi:hypothetical protein
VVGLAGLRTVEQAADKLVHGENALDETRSLLVEMSRITKTCLALACVALLAMPAVAVGQSGTQGYQGNDGQVQGVVNSGDNGGGPTGGTAGTVQASAPVEGSSLPFTGAELGVLAAVGAALVLVGFGLRRVTRRPSSL